jgi:L-fuculose-phosphate aldolase
LHNTIFALKRQLVEVGKRVYDRGYVASNDGNISARIDDKRVVITPTGVSKGYMKQEDMIVVDYDGKVLSGKGKPSSEVFMHLRIYRERADVNSVCHAHPPYATGFAVAGRSLEDCVLPEVVIVLGGIPLVDYGTPGTDEFYTPVLKYLQDHDAFLLANHGALAIGKDILSAYHKMETLEHFAHIAFVAQQLGQVTTLSSGQVDKLMALREKFGITTAAGCVSCANDGTGSCSMENKTGPGATAEGKAVPCSSYRERDIVTSGVDKEALVKQVTEAVIEQID